MNYFCLVKQSVRIFGSVLLAAHYCLVISLLARPFVYVDLPCCKANQQEVFQVRHPGNPLIHTAETDLSLTLNSPLNVQVLSFPGGSEKAVLKVLEQELASVFNRYCSIAIRILVNSRKSDIIFPFHYFW
jgi:hypothetical protein